MLLMLDTSICIYIIRKHPPAVIQKIKQFSPSDIVISSITAAELDYGASKSSNPEKNRQTLMKFLTPFEIHPFDETAAVHYGDIRAHLERSGKTIGAMDMLIAAHARSQSLTLITNNLREFERVPGLRAENWV